MARKKAAGHIHDEGDSVAGTHKVMVTFREVSANSGDFEVFGNSIGTPLAVYSNQDGWPAAFDRWFRVSITLQPDGTFDVCIDDIGPTSPTSGSGDPARGNILTFAGGLSPAASIDTLRLDVGSGCTPTRSTSKYDGSTETPRPSRTSTWIKPFLSNEAVAPMWSLHDPSNLNRSIARSFTLRLPFLMPANNRRKQIKNQNSKSSYSFWPVC